MCCLVKGGLDGKAYYQLLIPKIIFDIVLESLDLSSFLFQVSAFLNPAEDQSQQEERVWKKAL